MERRARIKTNIIIVIIIISSAFIIETQEVITQGNEVFISGLFNITQVFYTAEYKDMTFQQVNDSVRGLIDSTWS